jgi:hypothetical protein
MLGTHFSEISFHAEILARFICQGDTSFYLFSLR